MRSRLLLLTLPIVAFFSAFSSTSQAAVQNRISGAVTGSGHVPLPNTIPVRALRSTDLGSAQATKRLDSLSLRFNMTDAQQADLTQLLAGQQNPNSASYHQWLTPEQFGARFGLSSSDIAKVSSWLTGQGFTVTGVAHSSTFITFTGTVAQVQQAFGTSIHTVSLNGEQHIANLTDPVLPSSIAGIVNAITGLNDFRVKPRVRVSTVQADPAHPSYTTTSGGVHYIAPGDFYTIYDVNPLITAGTNGAGMTIAVMGQTTISLADVAAFRTASGLSANAPVLQLVGANPGLSPSDIDEAQLDTEWSGAVAPNATIKYVYGVDVFANSLTSTIDTKPVPPIVSISYGLCESGFGTSFLNTYTLLLQQANAEGMTIITPAGDSGAADCDELGLASEGLAVDFPASSPFATAMGGTMFNEGASTSTYWNTTNGANSGSAKSYIPELPWNETNSSTGLSAGGAGGGGASAFFSKPAWQVGTGVPADSSRDVPDISLNAAAIHDGYIVCSRGSCTNGYLSSNGQINIFGGTSVAVPTFAGILALTEQKLGATTGLGNIGPNLYGLARYSTDIFHDVTSGNNAVPCIQGTPNCVNNSSIGYTAGPGYDQATGLGSINAFNFANEWKLAPPTGGGSTIGTIPTNTVLSTSSAMCAISSGSFPLSVTVNSQGSSSTPSGSVQFFVDNVAVGSPVPLSNGSAIYTLSTAGLASGQHNVSAVYSGDATFAGSKGSFFQTGGTILPIDVVSTTKADFSITPCTGASTVITGSSAGAVTLTITPFSGFQGSVNLAANSDTGDVLGYAFSVKPVVVSSSTGVTTSFVLTATELSTNATLNKPKPGHSPLGRSSWYAAGSGATLACMLLFTVPRRRRWAALLAFVLSVAVIGAAGCGSSSSTTGGGGGGGPIAVPVAPGVYNITITATSGTLVHSSVITYTVVQ
jgi:subtilase family serine protease